MALTVPVPRRGGVPARCSPARVIRARAPREPVARRDPILRAWPLAADVFATAVVLVWSVGAFGQTGLQPLALLVLPLVLLSARDESLHDGERRLGLVHLATLCAVLVFLLHAWIAAGALAPHQALLLWAAIFALVLGCRRLEGADVAATVTRLRVTALAALAALRTA